MTALRSHLDALTLAIPPGAGTLPGFRRWAASDEFPREGYHISYIAGELLIDMSPEEINVHNWIKLAVTLAWGNLAEQQASGRVYPDRVLLTHVAADLSSEPDATFALWDTLRSGRLRAVPMEGDPRRSMELEGTPDCVVEIVSPSSVRRDTKLLRAAYHRAGIPEYWLIDGTRDPIKWELLRHEANGYVPTRAVRGWVRSDIFNHSFKFERSRDPMGNWRYSLRSKA
jgi:Uma2 family endonuclease